MSKQDYSIIMGTFVHALILPTLQDNEFFIDSYSDTLKMINDKGWPDSFIFIGGGWSAISLLENLWEGITLQGEGPDRKVKVYLVGMNRKLVNHTVCAYNDHTPSFRRTFELIPTEGTCDLPIKS